MTVVAPTPTLTRLVLPGFPELRDLRCEPWGGEGSPFLVLSSDTPPVRFVVVPPKVFFPDYKPEIPAEILSDLRLRTDEGLLLVILTVGRTPEETTANLLGPLVVNSDSGRARQAVLNPAEWSARAPIAPAVRPE